ncbi:MAG: glycoside hydrolase family 9 protein [Acidobacteriaceae bacterium]|nr:glycoside hydrolase family 9 protein [Acidobacteriaceae bacterium]
MPLILASGAIAAQMEEGATKQISLDQAGYLPDLPKIAIVIGSTGQGKSSGTFVIRRTRDQSVAFRGALNDPVFDPDSGDRVQSADFTSLAETGRFYLDVAGVGRSWNFDVGRNVFMRPYYLAMRSYYGQRCGTAVDLGPEFPAYKHAPCHLEGAYEASSGKIGTHVSSGGWHDAGDYGRYVVNSGISTGTLLWAWELYGDRVKKISLHIPESGNGTPDILNEIRWNLDWMLTMQDTDGGVWHKQTSTHFCGFIMPEKDTLVSYVIGTGRKPFKSSCATGDFAAVMAIAARVYRSFNRAYSRRCLAAAERAWLWLGWNPDVTFRNPHGITTGEYGDAKCGDEQLWAAAELLRTTGERQYEEYFLQHCREYLDTIRPAGPPSWSMVAPLALWAYVLGNGKKANARNAIRQRSIEVADRIAERTRRHACRISLTRTDYIWGSNSVAANYGMQLLIADRLQPSRLYAEAAIENLHYLLGRNPFSLSWVTQVGENAFRHPHHRPSAADGLDLPWPGLMAGGPNRGRQDSYMKKLLSADLPPGKMYVDERGAYACNEVAINWNAPLVFVLAASLPQ